MSKRLDFTNELIGRLPEWLDADAKIMLQVKDAACINKHDNMINMGPDGENVIGVAIIKKSVFELMNQYYIPMNTLFLIYNKKHEEMDAIKEYILNMIDDGERVTTRMMWDSEEDFLSHLILNLQMTKPKDTPFKYMKDIGMYAVFQYMDETVGHTVTPVNYEVIIKKNINRDNLSDLLFFHAAKNTMDNAPCRYFIAENRQLKEIDREDWDGNGALCISNTMRINGACTMFYPGLLRSVADQIDNDLVILPIQRETIYVYPKVNSHHARRIMEYAAHIMPTLAGIPLSSQLLAYDREKDRLYIHPVKGDT